MRPVSAPAHLPQQRTVTGTPALKAEASAPRSWRASSAQPLQFHGGTACGCVRSAARIDQKIGIDELIKRGTPIERINEAFDLMHRRESGRLAVVF